MDVYEKKIVVESKDIDFNGHVHNLKFIEWMINSALEHSFSKGFDEKFYKDHNFTWFTKSHKIEYKKPAFEGEKLTLKTWIDEVKRVSAIRKYEILRRDELLATGESEWVFVDMETSRPKRIPPEIVEKFK